MGTDTFQENGIVGRTVYPLLFAAIFSSIGKTLSRESVKVSSYRRTNNYAHEHKRKNIASQLCSARQSVQPHFPKMWVRGLRWACPLCSATLLETRIGGSNICMLL